MANEKKNVHRYFEVYEAMKNAVPDDNNMLEVMRAWSPKGTRWCDF